MGNRSRTWREYNAAKIGEAPGVASVKMEAFGPSRFFFCSLIVILAKFEANPCDEANGVLVAN